MKKIISSVGVIVFVAALTWAGTGAFFSDTETSTGNVFTAGAIDLKVDSVAHVNGLVCFDGEWVPESEVEWVPTDGEVEAHLALVEGADVASATAEYNEDFPSNVPQAGDECEGTWTLRDLDVVDEQEQKEIPAYRFFDYSDLKPGDSGENTISLHVFNNDAYMCATVDTVEDNDNSQTEPEAEVDADGLLAGELDSELEFVIWEDDGDNVLEEDEEVLVQTDNAEGIDGNYDLFTALNGALPAEEVAYLGVYWCYGDISLVGNTLSCDGSDVGNVSQTDSLAADIAFYVEQARHNEDFTCEERDPEPVVTRLTLAKTVTPAEVVPDSAFTLTASNGTTSISGIEGSGNVTMAVVTPGVYTLGESGGVEGAVATWSCTGNATPEAGNTVTIAEGETVTCEVTNTYTIE